MAVTFALRGNSTTAYRALGVATPSPVGTVTTTTGGINGLIDMDQAAGAIAQHTLIYPGARSISTTQKLSILMSFQLASAADVAQLFYIGGPASNWGQQARTSGSNTLVSTVNQKTTGASLVGPATAWTPTANTIYDVVWVIDGTLTTGFLKTYVNGVLLASTNSASTRAALDANMMSTTIIMIGAQNALAQNSTRLKLNEFVLWDTAIDPTVNQALTSGNGMLSGATRTAYVDAVAFDGADTNPGAANTRLATTYNFDGTTYTGTLVPTTGSRARIVNS
jgi:hypothetical protein